MNFDNEISELETPRTVKLYSTGKCVRIVRCNPVFSIFLLFLCRMATVSSLGNIHFHQPWTGWLPPAARQSGRTSKHFVRGTKLHRIRRKFGEMNCSLLSILRRLSFFFFLFYCGVLHEESASHITIAIFLPENLHK